MLNVVCFYHPSPVYTLEYPIKLYNAVKRNLTVPFWFYCLTSAQQADFPAGICPIAFEDLGIDLTTSVTRHPIWWQWIQVFKPGLFKGTVLYLDTDIFITGNIDFLAEQYDSPLTTLRDFYNPRGLNMSVVQWTPCAETEDFYTHLLNGGWENAKKMPLAGQHYLPHRMQECGWQPDIIQDRKPGMVMSYKADYLKNRKVNGAHVVCCHGEPKPHQIKDQELTRHWV